MSPAGLSWLQTLVGGVVTSLLGAAIISACVWCWRKCCINRDAEVAPSNADTRQNLKMKRLCCSDASPYSRAEEARSVLLHVHTRTSDSSLQGPEGSPQTQQEQDEDSRQGAVEPEGQMYQVEADRRSRTELAKHIGHSGHEFQLQDVQGENDIEREGTLRESQAPDGSLGTQLEQDGQWKNDIEREGTMRESQAPDGSLGTQLEQDGQSGQEVLPLATHDEHSEGLRVRRGGGLHQLRLLSLDREGLVLKKKRQS